MSLCLSTLAGWIVAAPSKFSVMSDVVPLMKTLFAWRQFYFSSKIRISNLNMDLSKKSRLLVPKMIHDTVLKSTLACWMVAAPSKFSVMSDVVPLMKTFAW